MLPEKILNVVSQSNEIRHFLLHKLSPNKCKDKKMLIVAPKTLTKDESRRNVVSQNFAIQQSVLNVVSQNFEIGI